MLRSDSNGWHFSAGTVAAGPGRRSVRVKELQAELDTIYRTFPDMKTGGSAADSARPDATRKRGARKHAARRAWSAADRQAVSDRMKKYWAARLGKTAKPGKTAKKAKIAR